MTPRGLLRLLFVVASTLVSQAAFGLDCQRPSSPTARAVCGSEKLEGLWGKEEEESRQLMAWARAKAPDRVERLGREMREWEEATSKWVDRFTVESLPARLQARIDSLMLVSGRAVPRETPEAEVDVDATLSWRWIRVQLPSRVLLRYPQLVRAVPASAREAINLRLRAAATEMLENYTSTLVDSDDGFATFRFEVLPSGQGFFQVQRFDESGGCFGGCAHPSALTPGPQLFDLEVGATPVSATPAVVGVRAPGPGTGSREAMLAAARTLAQPQLKAHFARTKCDGAEGSHELHSWSEPDAAQCALTTELGHAYAARVDDETITVPLRSLPEFRSLLVVNEKALENARRRQKAGLLSAETMKAIDGCVAWVRSGR